MERQRALPNPPTKESISVFCRVRPGLSQPPHCLNIADLQGIQVTNPHHSSLSSHFAFSRVFPPHTTQEQVYDHSVRPLVRSILDGKNVAVICYGQTGSGKTHTMLGPGDALRGTDDAGVNLQSGLIPRLCHDVFHAVDTIHLQSFSQCIIRASYIELYQEHVLDLLSLDRQELADRPIEEILRHCGSGLSLTQDRWGLRVTGACQETVTSVEEVFELMNRGTRVRATAATNCNEYSSRSHAVFILTVINQNNLTGRDLYSQVYLVDLAGSEKLNKTNAKGSRLREGQTINRGLLALSKVINALCRDAKSKTEASSHIPYRDSKLTRVLQNAFGGNGRTVVICNISPDQDSYQETVSTLRFGSRSQMIKNSISSNLRLRTRVELDKLLTSAEQIIMKQKTDLTRAHHAMLRCTCQSESIVLSGETICVSNAQSRIGIEMFLCPLTHDVFYDPVLCSDGFTYERAALIHHFALRGLVSPLTGSVLMSDQIIPNNLIATLVLLAFPQLRCFASHLPVELLLLIFSTLRGVDLLQCAFACRSWNNIIFNCDSLWINCISREFGRRLAFSTATEAKQRYFELLLGHTSTGSKPRRRLPMTKDLKLFSMS